MAQHVVSLATIVTLMICRDLGLFEPRLWTGPPTHMSPLNEKIIPRWDKLVEAVQFAAIF